MSIEYTIDIQLTELGYPDILQTSVRETPCRSTSPDDSFPPSHTPTSLSTTQVQRLLVRGQHSVAGKEAGAAKQTPNVEQTTAVSPSPPSESCTPRNPTQDLQDGQAIKGTATPEESEPTVADPQLTTEQGGDRNEGVDGRDASQVDSTEMQDAADDSDDSEVSELYEEEEIDEEEDDDEDEVNNESSHSGDYCCSVCDLQLASKFKLQDHMNLHTGTRPYCCAECGKRFCQIYNYRVHLRTHAQTKVDPLQCRVCRVGFASQEDLKGHLSRTHFENQFYECDLCKHVFTSLKACESHVQLHKWRLDVTCEICGRNFATPKSLARHRRVTCHRSFKCTDCTKTFPKKNALLKHSFSHLGLLPYTCIRCRCHFRLAKLYRKHKCEPERIHCVACLREFLSQEDFQQHKKDTGCWGNQEPKGDEIRCLECGQRFETTEELKKHAGAHQRVLKCAECGKGFRSALLLMSHMGGHAGNSPCLCQSCGLGFPHQQNYDSHLKTCGQTPQPASAPKKRQTSKSSSSETKKVDAKPDSWNPTNAAAVPAAVVNYSAAPVKGSPSSPGLVTGGVSPGSGPSDGLWKLTLNSQPPPGVKLVVFLPVCASQTDGLTHTPAISPTLPVPAMQGQHQNAPPPLSNEHFGVNAALGAPANGPLNLVSGVKRNPEWEAPLDLSNKCDSSKSPLSNTPPPIKREPGECEVSEKANSSEQQECKNGYSKTVVKTNPRETATFTEGKRFKVDPLDLSSFNVDTTSSGLVIDIKSEPRSPGPVCEPWSSTSCQLTEKEIKMEVDISHPTEEK